MPRINLSTKYTLLLWLLLNTSQAVFTHDQLSTHFPGLYSSIKILKPIRALAIRHSGMVRTTQQRFRWVDPTTRPLITATFAFGLTCFNVGARVPILSCANALST